MMSTRSVERRGRRQFRLSVAKLRGALSLRVRLAVLIALVVTIVVSASAYLQVRSFEASARRQLLDTAKYTAQAVADDLGIQDKEIIDDPSEVADSLEEFREAVPATRWISVVKLDPKTRAPKVYASTRSTDERPEALAISARALETKSEAWGNPDDVLQSVAVPMYRTDDLFGSVVVTISLSSIQELHQAGRRVVVWFVLLAIVTLTVVMDLLARRLIHKPIGSIRATMQRAAAGDLSARAPVLRRDEIGAVAEGLNEMLAEMENFNVALQARVREATAELRESNRELVDSYKRMFALREALARAEQMAAVGQTAASVAHQIGTPLNLISGYVQMLVEEPGADSRISRRLEIVQEQIRKVTTIVRTMLDHARRPVPRQPTSVAQMVQRVCDVARPKLDAAGVKLTVEIEPELPDVNADVVQLELALLNLITNSLDAMPEGGTLNIDVASIVTVSGVQGGGAGVRITVSDTGAGIAPELLPKIFDPWVTTKSVGRGSGLGLSITRDVIATHGGTITAASTVGAGATFTIDVPAAPVPAATGGQV